MEKDAVITPTPRLLKVPPTADVPVRAMSLAKAKTLICKTSGEHAELFRRLAK